MLTCHEGEINWLMSAILARRRFVILSEAKDLDSSVFYFGSLGMTGSRLFITN